MNEIPPKPKPGIWKLLPWLLAPLIASLLTYNLALSHKTDRNFGDTAAVVLLGTSLVSAICCSILMTKRLGATGSKRILINMFLFVLLFGMNLTISVMGCSPAISLQ